MSDAATPANELVIALGEQAASKEPYTLVFWSENFRSENLTAIDASALGFFNCDFSGAILTRAQFTSTHFRNCQFGQAQLRDAQMQLAVFVDCHFEGADLTGAIATQAKYSRCVLSEANFQKAELDGAQFARSPLTKADLTSTSMLKASGFILDETTVFRTTFSMDATDPWTTLRQIYTGPRFAINFTLLIAFVLVLVAKVFTFQAFALLQATDILEGGLSVYCQTRACEVVTLSDVILGFRDGAQWFVIASLAYNAIRALLTLMVATLRDQESRTHISPAYAPYHTERGTARAKAWLTKATQYYAWMHLVHRYVLIPLWVFATVNLVLVVYRMAGSEILLPTV